LWMTGGSVNLAMSSSTVYGGPQGAGIYLDQGNSGLLSLSTNTIRPSAQYGLYARGQGPGTQVWVTSNTILPMLSAARDTYGLYFDGLTAGATVQDNGIFLRNPANIGVRTIKAVYAANSSNLLIERNRISNPGMLTGGSFTAIHLQSTPNNSLKFNDFHSTGTGLTDHYMVRPILAGNTEIKNNIFFSSVSVTGSSATFDVPVGSFGGFASDYNDFFSSNPYSSAIWGNVSYPLLSGWRTAASQDPNSIRAHPRWADVSAGAEDFHPRSKAGRYNPASGLMNLVDTVHSAGVDRGAPYEPFAQEPAPNGGRVNMGSYGNTAQASQGGLLCSTATNVRGGEWSDPETWDIGVEPGTCNKVDIATGTVVTVDGFYATASTIQIYGTLSFSRVSNSSLTLVAGDLVVNPGGHLDMGTEASPIPTAVNSHLILSSGTYPGQYGLTVKNGGSFTIRGSTKSPYGFASASIAAAGTNLAISASSAAG
ncbi:MAG: G8 domain-containing protein, partial [Elusimicrobiota bacterium]